MIRSFLAFFFAAAALLSPATTPAQQDSFRVLAFYTDKGEPDHIDFANQALPFFAELAKKDNFHFEATTRWEDLNAEKLKNIQLVLWINDFPKTPEQRAAFENYMTRGGAWLGFHVSAYNDQDTHWPWFLDFLGGGVFYGNNWPPLPAKLVVDDRSHPVTRNLPATFIAPANEWYIWKPSPRQNKDVKVLLTLDPANYPIGLKDTVTGGDLPVVWTNTRYRMLYMNMGHGDKIFISPDQNNLFENAVLWLRRSLVLVQESRVSIEEHNQTEQLRAVVDTGLNAARLQNTAKLEGIAHDLAIPDPLTWFVATFGKEQGANMASAYQATLEREEKKIPWLFERLTKREGELLIQNAATTKSLGSSTCAKSLLNSAKENSSFYRAGLEWNNGPNTRGFWSLGYFTLVEGKYRRLDCDILGLGSDGNEASGFLHGLPILKVKGPEQASKILYSLPPVYPEEARRNQISGEVRLHVLLARDGTVEEVEVLSGHPLLQDAALEAVRQWRYGPTLVQLRPVEVDTIVEVDFVPSK